MKQLVNQCIGKLTHLIGTDPPSRKWRTRIRRVANGARLNQGDIFIPQFGDQTGPTPLLLHLVHTCCCLPNGSE
ncbi:hypothetical protein W823_02970 [Williamsia sp. D3]|nr:hypothetical protein W823_02970 [Williamsia sp. D3]